MPDFDLKEIVILRQKKKTITSSHRKNCTSLLVLWCVETQCVGFVYVFLSLKTNFSLLLNCLVVVKTCSAIFTRLRPDYKVQL